MGEQLRLGKRPYRPDSRDLTVKAVFAEPLPEPPARFGYGEAYPDWQMLGNGPDPTVAAGFGGCGDCVFAGAAHETMLWNHEAGREVTFDGKAVVSDYSAVTGYVVGDENTDQGTDVRDALLYRQKTGVVDAAGVRHRIGAFVALTAGDYDELMRAAWTFEVVGIGIQFPDSAMDQFDRGQVWDVVAGAQIDGGHYVPVTGRVAPDDNGCLTWARRQGFTRAFYEKYADEAWGLVTEEELAKGVNRRGLDLSQLQAALNAL